MFAILPRRRMCDVIISFSYIGLSLLTPRARAHHTRDMYLFIHTTRVCQYYACATTMVV